MLALPEDVLLKLQPQHLEAVAIVVAKASCGRDCENASLIGDNVEPENIEEIEDASTIVVPAPGPIVPIPVPDPSVTCKTPGFTHLKVNFDAYSHASGNQRAFIARHAHDRCRLFTFTHQHRSNQHAVAYLFAWAMQASRWPDRSKCKDHIAAKPSDDLVEAAYNEL